MPFSSPHASPTGSSSSLEESLRCQIEKLRVSTREEMLKSWAEVEQLQREKEDSVERNLELACQLRQSKEREEELQQEVIDLKRRLGDPIAGEAKGLRAFMTRQESKRSNNPRDSRSISTRSIDTSSTTEHSSESNIEMSGMSLPPPKRGIQREGSKRQGLLQREGSLRFSWPNNNSRNSLLAAEKERLESEFITQINEMEREKEELLVEMRTKVVCRDSVLESMEHTQKAQGETLERLREDLKHQDRRAREREDELSDQIHGLKKKLKEKRKVIADQRNRLKDFKTHIDDLTSRLEHGVHTKKRGSLVARRVGSASA